MTMYQCLNDAPNPALRAGSTKIWYAKPEHFHIHPASVDADQLTKTHILLGSVTETQPDVLFATLQGETWSPNGEARDLIQAKGLAHTSMSIGDCIQYADGSVLVVAFIGFTTANHGGD